MSSSKHAPDCAIHGMGIILKIPKRLNCRTTLTCSLCTIIINKNEQKWAFWFTVQLLFHIHGFCIDVFNQEWIQNISKKKFQKSKAWISHVWTTMLKWFVGRVREWIFLLSFYNYIFLHNMMAASELNIQTFFLPLFPKTYSLTTICIAFTVY